MENHVVSDQVASRVANPGFERPVGEYSLDSFRMCGA